MGAPNCDIYTGALHDACVKTNKDLGYDAQGNPIPGYVPPSSGGSIFGVPLPGSDWQRHITFRIVEVIVGVAMIIAGVKALTSSSPTVKVIASGVKKVGTKV